MFGLLFLAVAATAMPQTNIFFGSTQNRKINMVGRIPGGEVFLDPVPVKVEEVPNEETCCCIQDFEKCQVDMTEEEFDLVGLFELNPRIVNRPLTDQPSPSSCPAGYKVCCSGGVGPEVTSVLGRSTCLPPTKVVNEPWVQGCEETAVIGETITEV